MDGKQRARHKGAGGFKFLHIDAPTTPDGNEINDIVPQLAENEYLGLINVGLDMHAVQSNLDSKTTFTARCSHGGYLRPCFGSS